MKSPTFAMSRAIVSSRAITVLLVFVLMLGSVSCGGSGMQRQALSEAKQDVAAKAPENTAHRKRFLENRSSLSTITVNILAPKPIAVNTTGFGHSVRDAVSESIEMGSGIVLFFVRFVIVMIPISVLLLLPGGLLLRYFIRRARRMRLAEALAGPTPQGAA